MSNIIEILTKPSYSLNFFEQAIWIITAIAILGILLFIFCFIKSLNEWRQNK